MGINSSPLCVLDQMPSAVDFFTTYWAQKPFVVRSAIAKDDISALISADELAGLSLDDAPQSRLMKTPCENQNGWSCVFGPFTEQDFADAGDKNWALLVQNVEQFHPDTAALLHHFDFAPRWLMDDIMVSYSEPGGSVGPHIDNYHVFLVQGQGRRKWTIGCTPLVQESYIEDLDFKILNAPIEGDDIELSLGDVLYLPPRFGHEGTTLESAMTFSVGFLGPKVSQLLSGYGQYLADCEDQDHRYVGAGLTTESSGFHIDASAVENLRNGLAESLSGPDFSKWLVEFFTESSHEDFGCLTPREEPLDLAQLQSELADGICLVKPPYVKFAITATPEGTFNLGFDAHSLVLDEALFPLVQTIMKERPLDGSGIKSAADLDLVLDLFNHHALEFDAGI